MPYTEPHPRYFVPGDIIVNGTAEWVEAGHKFFGWLVLEKFKEHHHDFEDPYERWRGKVLVLETQTTRVLELAVETTQYHVLRTSDL